ncbi:phosphoribosylglycinamide formyltransferase [Alkaliphilus peptidifermentans]|uniref:Phosphoribosylglycinamide formyltransferase n=1 Tax=Alkaliphilus peptidifermentans DSM 18978 TaxID=1120976 RepID=A0A1G5I9I3_9FIRM|nr:phosphoribosylglycinamide formyltransferase [Alkaliphilus peptidifermentans]SCY72411.1 formyltetrahydrofolate-dependent phosphoribosylglycinamide formyltransferase [Alkaliphilus peptidifermentans DSM 18978]
MSRLKVAVLISGGGTNLQALIDEIEKGYINAEIKLVISSNKNAYGLIRAEKHNIPTIIVDRYNYSNKDKRQKMVLDTLEKNQIDLVVLAGYLEIISNEVIEGFRNRIINIHPSLIPSFSGRGYYGERVHQEAIARGVKVSGATVHFVNEETDGGPIIIQEAISVEYEDNEKTLQMKVLKLEHKILPQAVKLFSEGRIEVVKNRVRIMEGEE